MEAGMKFQVGRVLLSIACGVLVSFQESPVLLVSQTLAQVASSPIVRYRGFDLAPGRCDVEAGYCAGRGPKDWTEEEIAAVRIVIDEIAAMERGAAVIAATQDRGTKAILRYDIGHSQFNTPDLIPAGFRGDEPRFIELSDVFFQLSGIRDARGKYRLQTKVVLHELFHSFDDNGKRFSERSGSKFPDLAGFGFVNGAFTSPFETLEEAASFGQAQQRDLALRRKGDFGGAWEISRAWSIGFKRSPLPSLGAFGRPREAFAEIAAHLVLDSTTPNYLTRELRRYFDDTVFLELDGSAK
jgi:hypothetical protein